MQLTRLDLEERFTKCDPWRSRTNKRRRGNAPAVPEVSASRPVVAGDQIVTRTHAMQKAIDGRKALKS